KIAVSGSREDRAATAFHDIGLFAVRAPNGDKGFRVSVGGGMGRTPMIGTVIREFLPWQEYLNYCEAILRVYNRFGRRANIYKARIKIIVRALGAEEFTRQVEEDFARLQGGLGTIPDAEYERVAAHFVPFAYATGLSDAIDTRADKAFARWIERNVRTHRVPG